MFAICSDLDHAVSLTAYLEFLKYLNTDIDTCYGTGLGLEVSNSCWFYNGENDQQLSYFKGTTTEESTFAPVCRDLWTSGHIDTLHSYGNFNLGGFDRSFAEPALEALTRHGATLPVWVNHGNDQNHQKLGLLPEFQGAKPDKNAYHYDLLKESGTRFFWMGRTTHVAGQDAQFNLSNQVQQQLQKLILATKYRNTERPLPDPENRLLLETTLEDGHEILEFQRFISRFGEVKKTDLFDLALQLSQQNLKALVKSEGFMVLYTHMNENLPQSQPLPLEVSQGFQRLARFAREKSLLVTTSSRLLNYADLTKKLIWKTRIKGGSTEISLTQSDPRPLKVADLQGLTFYCDTPEKTVLFLNDKQITTDVNPTDHTGRGSLSVPWQALEYPF